MNWKEIQERLWRELREAMGKQTQYLVIIDEAAGLDKSVWDCES